MATWFSENVYLVIGFIFIFMCIGYMYAFLQCLDDDNVSKAMLKFSRGLTCLALGFVFIFVNLQMNTTPTVIKLLIGIITFEVVGSAIFMHFIAKGVEQQCKEDDTPNQNETA